MITQLFLIIATLLNLALGFTLQFKSYQRALRLLLFGLGILFVIHLWAGYISVLVSSAHHWFAYQRFLQILGLIIAVACLELTRRFLRGGEIEPGWKLFGVRFTPYTICLVGAAVSEIILWLPELMVPSGDIASPLVRFNGLGLLAPTMRILIAIYTLYLLENTYRFSQDYQRRIARLCFIGLGCLAIFHTLVYAHVLLYHVLPAHFAEASSVVYGVIYPIILIGFLRYRLGSEFISIPRDTIYTSITVFLTGAAFLGIALTILIFQWLNLDFNYFEKFLVGFSLCFLAILVLGSGTMRRRITRFINERFYSRKYDYQDQFFRLHKTATSGSDLDGALTELVENMKYSVTVDDAYFFILNWQDGNYYQQENKEESTIRGLVISGDSPLVQTLAVQKRGEPGILSAVKGLAHFKGLQGSPVDLLSKDEWGLARRTAVREESLVYQLKIDAFFPIFLGERLAGFLALKGGRIQAFDQEDLDLIAVFTTSIGDAIFKHRVLNERIEKKQFESFHHVASFIIHDIKNQIATLNLLLKNAERNIGNPSFQTSMLTSVNSCAVNLQNLIDKLSVAPKGQVQILNAHPLKPLIEEVIQNSAVLTVPGLVFELSGESHEAALMDRQALFFVVRNLINNSLEALNPKNQPAQLSLSFGLIGNTVPQRLRELFGGGDRFFTSFSAFILLEDNGLGMEPEFVQRRLFQPFATTKEKGVGIGLYQCKTMVEKMGGRILCHSVLGKGTEFCILLPTSQSKN